MDSNISQVGGIDQGIPVLGLSLGSDLLVSASVFILTIIAFRVFKYFILRKLRYLATKTRSDLDDLVINIVEGIRWPFYVVLAFYFSLSFLDFTHSVFILKALEYTLMVIVVYYAVKAVQAFIDYGTRKVILKKKEEEEVEDISLINNIANVLKLSVWGFLVILLLDNLGYDINALVAGLGIGGIAIALAIQNILGDIFSSLSIHFDKPFAVGDFIVVGGDAGVVKKIGIKTTRIQTLQGEELVISNNELTSTRVHNYKRMEKRRIVFGFGVVYETSTEKLKQIPGIVTEIVNSIDLVELDRIHFKEFGDFSLNFEVVYYINSSDYTGYMDSQQAINLGINERFEKENIVMAYPTQTIYMGK
ncbi:MAG: mechanosensitive ion channel family protein [Candidatus Altiarchaeota archaeon]|nr:mechanosensitive ion channel family protein [Candidatus Altiarchaeota archaeon]